MPKTTDEQLLKLWRISYSLSKAAFTFARAEDQAKWKALHENSAIEAFRKNLEAASDSEDDGFAKFGKALSTPQKIIAERTDHITKLQRDVLRYIRNGHLHGYGFETPRTLNAVPVAIPKQAWAGKIEWDKNALTFESIKLVEVRLITKRIRNEILGRGNVDPSPTNAPGRPSTRQDIEAAFHALHKAGEINPSKSQSSHFPKVRAWLDLHRPDMDASEDGLNDETIRRHFSRNFKYLNKTTKQ
ncbi:hypothetical protein [Roseovarius pacificus]|uniref:hypothetical protein n=1 Tax=Roseovarius pacificus TaxID=337701 RepID=UPI002A18844A|nr:hypothetical protein [Roseovarius pacificus]